MPKIQDHPVTEIEKPPCYHATCVKIKGQKMSKMESSFVWVPLVREQDRNWEERGTMGGLLRREHTGSLARDFP